MNSSEMDNSFVLGSNIKVLTYLGIWPYQSKRSKMLIRPLIYLLVVSLMMPQQIRLVFEMRIEKPEIIIIVEGIGGLAFFLVILSRYTNYIIFENQLKNLYEEIGKDYKSITDKDELRVIHKMAEAGKKMSNTITFFFMLGGVTVLLLNSATPLLLDLIFPLASGSRPLRLCYYAEYFVDQEIYFKYLLLQTLVTGCVTTLVLCVTDGVYINCAYHTLGLFQIVDYRLNNSYRVFKFSSKCDFYTFIVDTAKIHKRSIEFTELLTRTYEKCFFFSTFLTIVGVVVGTVAMVYSIHYLSNFLRLLIIFVATMIHLFYINWPGQAVMDASYQLYKSTYSTNWYEFPRDVKYILNFMMTRCTKPCQLTAGPILILNLETFKLILNTALSYFTMAANLTYADN